MGYVSLKGLLRKPNYQVSMSTFLGDQHHIGFQSIYKAQQAEKVK